MSWYEYNYVDQKAAKARTARLVEKRRKKGETLQAVVPTAKRSISSTFWGMAWNRNLESYSDYENRLPRGRTYLRQGNVMDLEVLAGQVNSTVMGSDLYEVRITIKPLAKDRWKGLKEECSGRIGTLVELLGGKLSDDIMAHVTNPKEGLFPAPKEIALSCSCPDYADLCKHAAATLYAVSVRLDQEPGLLFTLRGVDAAELIGSNAFDAVASLTTSAAGGDGTLDDSMLVDVFGISFEEPLVEAAPAPKAKAPEKKKVASRKVASKKAAGKKTSARKVAAKKQSKKPRS